MTFKTVNPIKVVIFNFSEFIFLVGHGRICLTENLIHKAIKESSGSSTIAHGATAHIEYKWNKVNAHN